MYSMNSSNVPVSQVPYQMSNGSNGQDDRFIAPFLGPFLLGGITGGLVAPLFYRPQPQYYPPYYYGPYPRYY